MDRYDDLINQFTSYTTLALHMLYKGFCGAFFITWAVSCRQRINVDGRKRFEYATFGRLFLWNGTGGKKSPFSKSIRTGLDGVSLAADAVVHPSHVPVSFFFIFLSLKTIRNSSGQMRRRYAFVLWLWIHHWLASPIYKSGPGWFKVGLVRNLNSDIKAEIANSVKFFSSQFDDWKDYKEIKKLSEEMLLNKRKRNPG